MQIPDLSNSIPQMVGTQGITPPSPAKTEPAGAGATNGARLKKACQEFEGQFFDLMLQEMRKTIPKDPLLGDDGHADEIFTGMMDDSVSQDMAKHGGPNDLSEQLYRQLTGANSFQPTPASTSAASASPLLGAGAPLGPPAGVSPAKVSKAKGKAENDLPTQDGGETSR
ncbi:MAG TPA: rod-binding protein [Capsulimonadaceae bacterium]|nr:rod-binding protein [Capsulimonadaceae bacterium]